MTKMKQPEKVSEYLRILGACDGEDEAVPWAEAQEAAGVFRASEMLAACSHAVWLTWLAGKLEIDPRFAVLIAVDCEGSNTPPEVRKWLEDGTPLRHIPKGGMNSPWTVWRAQSKAEGWKYWAWDELSADVTPDLIRKHVPWKVWRNAIAADLVRRGYEV